MSDAALINVHAVIPSSSVNGPGRRMVIFFQGCARGCPGCFNPGTHAFGEKTLRTASEIFRDDAMNVRLIEGVTISGGEPFAQVYGLLDVLKAAKDLGLTTVVYTGYRHEELLQMSSALSVFKYTDVLIDGAYEVGMPEPTLLARGSTNQKFHFFSDRYGFDDFCMQGKAEVIIRADGSVVETGFSRV